MTVVKKWILLEWTERREKRSREGEEKRGKKDKRKEFNREKRKL